MPVACSFNATGSTSCSPSSHRAPQPTIAVLSLDGGGLKGLLTLVRANRTRVTLCAPHPGPPAAHLQHGSNALPRMV